MVDAPPQELIGHSIFEEYPGIDQTPMFAKLRRSMEDRLPQVFETEFTFPDGTTRWFELRVQPAPEGICVYSSDIDQRKRRRAGIATGSGAAFCCGCGGLYWAANRRGPATIR